MDFNDFIAWLRHGPLWPVAGTRKGHFSLSPETDLRGIKKKALLSGNPQAGCSYRRNSSGTIEVNEHIDPGSYSPDVRPIDCQYGHRGLEDTESFASLDSDSAEFKPHAPVIVELEGDWVAGEEDDMAKVLCITQLEDGPPPNSAKLQGNRDQLHIDCLVKQSAKMELQFHELWSEFQTWKHITQSRIPTVYLLFTNFVKQKAKVTKDRHIHRLWGNLKAAELAAHSPTKQKAGDRNYLLEVQKESQPVQLLYHKLWREFENLMRRVGYEPLDDYM
ncbi:hypothetical protein F5Y09DRAFT_348446 [Xylaria sp. FL1042]|nr:hypothetical protein F5Y09DRAFT_348446 [Xylaria sp. FL1042]